MADHLVTAEVSSSKLVATFPSVDTALDAADALVAATDIEKPQLRLIAPEEVDLDIALEPEGGNLWRTLVVAHVRLGLVGALAGLVLFVVLWSSGVPYVVGSPWAAAAVAIVFGAIAGLLLGGLVLLRPDHSPYIEAARRAREEGQTTIIVHALSAAQRARAAKFLGRCGGSVTQTL
jgi:hypothetical protein